jgi:hypothetical protein
VTDFLVPSEMVIDLCVFYEIDSVFYNMVIDNVFYDTVIDAVFYETVIDLVFYEMVIGSLVLY